MPRRPPLLRTWLHTHPSAWDQIFPPAPATTRFVERLLRREGGPLLDVGCATGNLCAELSRRGLDVDGIDLTGPFIEAARAKAPSAWFAVGDMRTFLPRRRYGVLTCLGTTFLYNTSNEALAQTLERFRRALRPRGLLVLDIVNAIALVAPLRFRASTRHRHRVDGEVAEARIEHRVVHARQTFTEHVTWHFGRRGARRDPPSELRLLFPQELRRLLAEAGFTDTELFGGFDTRNRRLDGPRLVALSRAGRSRR